MDKISTNNWILIGVGAAIILLIGWWAMTSAPATSTESADTGEEMSDENSAPIDVAAGPSTTSDGESVSVSNQLAGETVSLSSVTFSETGWVAVRDDRGWTLGAKRFEAGTHGDAVITLLRGTEAGQRYQVLLYVDDGDRLFDVKKEILVTRSDGSVAGAMFSAQ